MVTTAIISTDNAPELIPNDSYHSLKKIYSWVQGGTRSPKKGVPKERLRALL